MTVSHPYEKFAKYQKATHETMAEDGASLAILALGLAGEAGEVADIVKKIYGHGHTLDIEKLKLELGDLLWYLSETATYLGLSLEEIAEANIVKLAKRYPEGFTTERSVNRED